MEAEHIAALEQERVAEKEFHVHVRTDHVEVALQRPAGEGHPEIQLPPAGGEEEVVGGVLGQAQRDLRPDQPGERLVDGQPRVDAEELRLDQVVVIFIDLVRREGDVLHLIRDVVPPEAPQLPPEGHAETGGLPDVQLNRIAGLVIVGIVVDVVAVAAVVDRESEQRVGVQEVWVGKGKGEVDDACAEDGVEHQLVAITQEVVGAVIDADERALVAADAAGEADGLLPLLGDGQVDVHRGFLGIALDLVILLLELFEEPELVQPLDADIQEGLGERLLLHQHELAPKHLVTGAGVAEKLDLVDPVLLALLHCEGDIRQTVGLVGLESRLDVEIDIPLHPVDLLDGVHPFLDGLVVGDIAFSQADQGQELLVGEQGVALELEAVDAVLRPLVDGDGDVELLLRFAQERQKAPGSFDDLHLGLAVFHVQVTVLLVQGLDVFLQVVEELVLVVLVGSLEHADQAALLAELERVLEVTVVEHRVAAETDPADADFFPLGDLEDDFHRIGGDLLHSGGDGAQRPPVEHQQVLDDVLGLLDLGGLVGGVHRQAQLFLTELVEDVRLLEGFHTLVGDRPDDGLLFDDEGDDPARLAVRDVHLDVLEQVGLVERLEIDEDLVLVKDVARPGHDVVEDGVLGDPVVAPDLDLLDQRAHLGQQGGSSGGEEDQAQQRQGTCSQSGPH